jgi:hypothetical protein
MPRQDVRVLGINHGVLARPLEDVVGMPHEVLVERVVLRDEHGQRGFAPAAGAPGPLPG